jgi:molybdopterin-guanine dinucleotide biosynthesis protein A
VRTAAIIAGGRAQRLGGLDKGDLVIGGRRIIDRQLSVLGHVAEHILIVSNDHHRFRSSGLRVCADLMPGAGPLGGLYTALVRSPTARTIVVACDLPFLTVSFLRHLVDRVHGADAAIPRTADGTEPLCAVYSRTCLEPIRARLERGELRVSALGDAIRVNEIGPAELASFDPAGTMFFNVNTPDDYTRASALATRDSFPSGRVS